MMPGRSGLDICRDVRARSPVPIILLTAKDQEVDKVVGLEVGADDYVTKPFSVRELLGRVRAQLRRRDLDRTSTVTDAKTIDAGSVRIDLARHLVSIRGEPVNLTRSEFQVLRLLAERPGQVFSRLEIMEELWQSEFSGDVRACDVHISDPAHGEHELGLLRVALDLLAQVGDVHVAGAHVAGELRLPELLHDLEPAENLTRALGEQAKYLKLRAVRLTGSPRIETRWRARSMRTLPASIVFASLTVLVRSRSRRRSWARTRPSSSRTEKGLVT